MSMSQQSVAVGVFRERAQAQAAIHELLQLPGITEKQIGYIVRDASGRQEGDIVPPEESVGKTVVAGAVGGGVIGSIVGAAASLLIPGLGPAVAGGILAVALGGAAIGVAAGSIISALTELGIPEEEARYYQGEFEAGYALVAVNAVGRTQEVIEVMRRHGAYDASTRSVIAEPMEPTNAEAQ